MLGFSLLVACGGGRPPAAEAPLVAKSSSGENALLYLDGDTYLKNAYWYEWLTPNPVKSWSSTIFVNSAKDFGVNYSVSTIDGQGHGVLGFPAVIDGWSYDQLVPNALFPIQANSSTDLRCNVTYTISNGATDAVDALLDVFLHSVPNPGLPTDGNSSNPNNITDEIMIMPYVSEGMKAYWGQSAYAGDPAYVGSVTSGGILWDCKFMTISDGTHPAWNAWTFLPVNAAQGTWVNKYSLGVNVMDFVRFCSSHSVLNPNHYVSMVSFGSECVFGTTAFHVTDYALTKSTPAMKEAPASGPSR
jgi:hypothetical protein